VAQDQFTCFPGPVEFLEVDEAKSLVEENLYICRVDLECQIVSCEGLINSSQLSVTDAQTVEKACVLRVASKGLFEELCGSFRFLLRKQDLRACRKINWTLRHVTVSI
jgi:hypothetical protein